MPFRSKAQQRFMYAAEARHELPEGTAERWAHHTKDIKSLPEHVKKKKKKKDDGEKSAGALQRYRQLLSGSRARGLTSEANKAMAASHNWRAASRDAMEQSKHHNSLTKRLDGVFAAGHGQEFADVRHLESQQLARAAHDESKKVLGARAATGLAAVGAGAVAHRAKNKTASAEPSFGDQLAAVMKSASLGSALARPSTVGRFSGFATANSLKVPGMAASTQAVNPRRSISSAMNVFKA